MLVMLLSGSSVTYNITGDIRMSNRNLKGFAEYYMTIDPEGLYTVKQVNTAKGYYKAGFDACNGKQTADTSYKSRIDEVIAHFNDIAGKNVTATPNHTSVIKGRLIEKYTVEQLNSIVDYAVRDWTGKLFGSTKGEQYIRIPTLFGSSEKVDKYLGIAATQAEERKPTEVLTKRTKPSTRPKLT